MIVQTPERRFEVLQILRRGEQEEISICRDLGEDWERHYLLARFTDPQLNRVLLPMLSRERGNTSFEDYLELFTLDGDLYARFRYVDAPTLSSRLEEGAFSFRERLELAGALAERMALLDMPPFLQFEALRRENVTVDDSLRVRFNYVLESVSACFNVNLGFVSVRLAEWMEEIFAPELDAQSAPELAEYIAWLESTACGSYLEMYSRYDGVRAILLGRELKQQVEPRTWLFRLWEKIKGLKRYVKPVLGGLVLVAAFCYLLYTLLAPAVPASAPISFSQIGTVEIRPS